MAKRKADGRLVSLYQTINQDPVEILETYKILVAKRQIPLFAIKLNGKPLFSYVCCEDRRFQVNPRVYVKAWR